MVTGEQDAVFFLVCDGSITRIASFRIEKPTFTDREGHIERRARGAIIASGAVREIRHEDIRIPFLRLFRESLRHVDRPTPYDAVYVFTPKQLKHMVTNALPTRIRKRLARVILGNHVAEHPLHLIAMIAPTSHAPPETLEAAKLLREKNGSRAPRKRS